MYIIKWIFKSRYIEKCTTQRKHIFSYDQRINQQENVRKEVSKQIIINGLGPITPGKREIVYFARKNTIR